VGEHPVEKHPDGPTVAGVHQPFHVTIVTQPGIDAQVVDDVVTVCFRGEDRVERQPVAAQPDQVVQPRLERAPDDGRRRPMAAVGSAPQKTERVDLPQIALAGSRT
jgi:hypothetical protein